MFTDFNSRKSFSNCEAVRKFIDELANVITDGIWCQSKPRTLMRQQFGVYYFRKTLSAANETTQQNEEIQECHWAVLK